MVSGTTFYGISPRQSLDIGHLYPQFTFMDEKTEASEVKRLAEADVES